MGLEWALHWTIIFFSACLRTKSTHCSCCRSRSRSFDVSQYQRKYEIRATRRMGQNFCTTLTTRATTSRATQPECLPRDNLLMSTNHSGNGGKICAKSSTDPCVAIRKQTFRNRNKPPSYNKCQYFRFIGRAEAGLESLPSSCLLSCALTSVDYYRGLSAILPRHLKTRRS